MRPVGAYPVTRVTGTAAQRREGVREIYRGIRGEGPGHPGGARRGSR